MKKNLVLLLKNLKRKMCGLKVNDSNGKVEL